MSIELNNNIELAVNGQGSAGFPPQKGMKYWLAWRSLLRKRGAAFRKIIYVELNVFYLLVTIYTII